MRRSIAFATVLALGLTVAPAAAQEQQVDGGTVERERGASRAAPVLEAVRVTGAEPRIDGALDDAAWATAPVATGFVQFAPDEGAPASEATEARVLYGGDALFVAIRALDSSPSEIAGQLTRRDQGSYSDFVAVVVDSYFDRRTAFHFEVNPVGVKRDIYRFNDTGEDVGWDAVWDVATGIDERGWTAEFRIPYSQLRFEDGDVQTWGINFVRNIARRDELSAWAPTLRSESAIVSRFGELRGLRDLEPPRRVELAPYSLARLERAPGDASDPFYARNDVAATVGADARYGVSSNLTLDMTLNPDFGQVEADPADVNLSAFETFYPEKRPFFLEGASLFHLPLQFGDGDGANEALFYSRRVGRTPQGSVDVGGDDWVDAPDQTTILGAWKLSGKTPTGWSIGFMDAVTPEERAEVALADGGREEAVVEPLTNYLVTRVAKDFREGRSAIGFLGTAVGRDAGASEALGLRSGAYAGGVDARHRFAQDRWSVEAYLLGSHVRGSADAIARTQRSSARYFQRPDADHTVYDPTRTSLDGASFGLALNKLAGGHWRFGTGVQSRTPGFEVNDAGFMREADYTSSFLYLGYDQSTPQGPFRRWRLNANAWSTWSWGGERMGTGGNVNGNFQLVNFWGGYMGVNHSARAWSTGLLRGGPAILREANWNGWYGLNSDSRKPVRLSMNGWWNARPESDSWTLGASPTVSWRPSGRADLSLGASFTRNVDDRQWVGRVAAAEDVAAPWVFGRMDQSTVGLTARVDYSFTPTLSLQVYAQPFVSAGDFGAFKRVADPRAARHAERFVPLAATPDGDGGWRADVDGDGVAETFGEPDFNVRQFRSNTVLRWEYRPGSTLFLVWAQGRSQVLDQGEFRLGGGLDGLFGVQPENIFMMKVSYWLNP
ncbi:MAG: carbohydrate binding family 9 domain-containing protein [Gemmatimonadetes bacterium]|nr:carbohydrate binding family 9 domain-containing protein [Gemmatimonadota bacterium]